MLRDVRASWGLDKASVVAQLTKQLQVDSNDFPAKNQMRLERICRGLCATRDAMSSVPLHVQIVVLVTSMASVDAIFYGILGKGGQRVPHTLRDLLDPRVFTIMLAQHDFLNLLQDFSVANDAWVTLKAFGADFGDAGLRKLAKQVILRLSSGLFQFYELDFSKPPDSVALCALKEIPRASLEIVFDAFMQLRWHSVTR